MEQLRRIEILRSDTQLLESILSTFVWNRPPVPMAGGWSGLLRATTGISVPDWALQSHECLTHGDPTLANLMMRHGNAEPDTPIIIDPVSPMGGRVPQIREIDQAKILQSMCGWEALIGGFTLNSGMWLYPHFMFLDQGHLRRVVFWLGVTVRRCMDHLREGDEVAHVWCNHLFRECMDATQHGF